MYYNKKGKKINVYEWLELFKDLDYRVIEKTKLNNGKFISTVWLGLDHSFSSNEKLIFETMVFPEKDNFEELDMKRYSTEKEAKAGHKKMVNKYKVK